MKRNKFELRKKLERLPERILSDVLTTGPTDYLNNGYAYVCVCV